MKPKLNYVLRQVNQVRKVLGQKPLNRMPKGVLESNLLCPLAVGFNKGCEVSSVYVEFKTLKDAERVTKLWGAYPTGNSFVRLPRWARDFVYRFDSEDYPTLISK